MYTHAYMQVSCFHWVVTANARHAPVHSWVDWLVGVVGGRQREKEWTICIRQWCVHSMEWAINSDIITTQHTHISTVYTIIAAKSTTSWLNLDCIQVGGHSHSRQIRVNVDCMQIRLNPNVNGAICINPVYTGTRSRVQVQIQITIHMWIKGDLKSRMLSIGMRIWIRILT